MSSASPPPRVPTLSAVPLNRTALAETTGDRLQSDVSAVQGDPEQQRLAVPSTSSSSTLANSASSVGASTLPRQTSIGQKMAELSLLPLQRLLTEPERYQQKSESSEDDSSESPSAELIARKQRTRKKKTNKPRTEPVLMKKIHHTQSNALRNPLSSSRIALLFQIVHANQDLFTVCARWMNSHHQDQEGHVLYDHSSHQILDFSSAAVRRACLTRWKAWVDGIHELPVDDLITVLFSRVIDPKPTEVVGNWNKIKSIAFRCWSWVKADNFTVTFRREILHLQSHILYELKYDILDLMWYYRELVLAYTWMRFEACQDPQESLLGLNTVLRNGLVWRQKVLANHTVLDSPLMAESCQFHSTVMRSEFTEPSASGFKQHKHFQFRDPLNDEQQLLVKQIGDVCYAMFNSIQRYRVSLRGIPVASAGIETAVEDGILDASSLLQLPISRTEPGEQQMSAGDVEELSARLDSTFNAFKVVWSIKLNIIRRRVKRYHLNYLTIFERELQTWQNNRATLMWTSFVYLIGVIVPLLLAFSLSRGNQSKEAAT